MRGCNEVKRNFLIIFLFVCSRLSFVQTGGDVYGFMVFLLLLFCQELFHVFPVDSTTIFNEASDNPKKKTHLHVKRIN